MSWEEIENYDLEPEIVNPGYHRGGVGVNNKGNTLVELVISMAITAVILTMVIAFLATNSNHYVNAENTVNLQMESQSVMNQLNDMIIEANWVELISVSTDVEALLIYNSVDIDVVFLDKSKQELYLVEDRTMAELADLDTISYSSRDNLMANHVAELTLLPTDIDQLLSEKQIVLIVEFSVDTLHYKVDQNIKFRNKPVKP